MNTCSRGYIALMSVLIMGAAASAIAITLLVTGTNSQRSTLVTQQAIQARQLASACAEEALQRYHDNTAYTGTGSLSLGTGSCTFTVTINGSVATITTTGSVNLVVKKLVIYATISASNISITSWQETT